MQCGASRLVNAGTPNPEKKIADSEKILPFSKYSFPPAAITGIALAPFTGERVPFDPHPL
jgi:hypothetical protein